MDWNNEGSIKLLMTNSLQCSQFSSSTAVPCRVLPEQLKITVRDSVTNFF